MHTTDQGGGSSPARRRYTWVASGRTTNFIDVDVVRLRDGLKEGAADGVGLDRHSAVALHALARGCVAHRFGEFRFDHTRVNAGAGRLVRLLEDGTTHFAGYVLYSSSQSQMRPVLAAFIATLQQQRGATVGRPVALRP